MSTVSVKLRFLPGKITGWRQVNVALLSSSYRSGRCSDREEGAGDQFIDLSECRCLGGAKLCLGEEDLALNSIISSQLKESSSELALPNGN